MSLPLHLERRPSPGLQGRNDPPTVNASPEVDAQTRHGVPANHHQGDTSTALARSVNADAISTQGAATAFDDLKDEIYQELCCKRLPEDDSRKHFFPNGTGEIVVHQYVRKIFDCLLELSLDVFGLDASRFAQRIKERELYTFIALIVYTGLNAKAWQVFLERFVSVNSWPATQESIVLPLTSDQARELFGAAPADRLLQDQPLFYAVVLLEKQLLPCDPSDRLPFTSEEEIGGGSFGRVVKVRIAPRHFRSQRRGFALNDEELEIARKEYVLEDFDPQHHKHELEVLRTLVQNDTKCDYITENLASLQIGQEYHLFMELAQCDLYQYMTEANPYPPVGIENKADIVRHAAGVARALRFLHEELSSDAFQHIICLHMDLKPQNVLVVVQGQEVRWKLSDFNISRVKPTLRNAKPRHKPGHGGHPKWLDFDSLFKRKHTLSSTGSRAESTLSPRMRGTYLAPEALEKPPKVSVESDIWSLGCVLSVIFSYMENGKKGVEEFERHRKQGVGDDQNDYFYTRSNPRKPPQLNQKVTSWFASLQNEARKRNPAEAKLVEDLLSFLCKCVLLPNREQRKKWTAKKICDRLSVIIEESKSKENNNVQSMLSSSLPMKTLRDLGAKDVQFSPNQELLAFISDSTVTVFSTVLLWEISIEPKNLIHFGHGDIETGRIQSVSISDRHILVATNLGCFDCYIFTVIKHTNDTMYTGEIKLHRRICIEKMGSIKRLAISPNSQYAVFHTSECARRSQTKSSFDFAKLVLPQEEEPTEPASTADSEFATAGEGILQFLHHDDLLSKAGNPTHGLSVIEMHFSKLNIFYSVIQIETSSGARQDTMLVRGWSLSDKKALQDRQIKSDDHDSSQDLFTTFAPHNLDAGFILVARENRILNRTFSETQIRQMKKVISYRLLKVLVGPEDKAVFALARQQGRTILELVRAPLDQSGDNLKPTSMIQLPGLKATGRHALGLKMLHGEKEPRVLLATPAGDIYHTGVG